MIPKDNFILLKGIRVYSEGKIIEDGYIKIKNKKILELGSVESLIPENTMDFLIIDFPSVYQAIPGLIDVHIHGVNGADTMDGTSEALDTMVTSLPMEGTTSFLATTMTQSSEKIEQALKTVGNYIGKQPAQGCAEILGIHLEGPFVNTAMAGAQPLEHIIDPDLSLFKEWEKQANHQIKLVTLAPELPNCLELIAYLKKREIIASIGHTNASYEEVQNAIHVGASHVTHLFNQMRGLHHREPGTAGAALLLDELKCELIVDGVHLRPEMVKLAYKQKGSKGLVLITDAMRAKCLKNGQYDLGGQTVHVKDGKATLENGTLAGSILKLGQAVKNIVYFTGCSLQEAIEMASTNPAKELKVFDRKGSIAVGKDADIVILDEHLEVVMTFCRGVLSYKKEEF
ncbi:N-acetylglucosamine-6-phosphate deacetylase [Bacillus sp. T3]|uniref:N-acetylglucosamine-6-phosphate deacetylase n=1 Tax=Bacillus sp. T3 TaxID=467262 RepID=UPI002981F2F0|nr:N-acetylglucosamine-6-phosphate deacetylase [Bacillus sp. T3]